MKVQGKWVSIKNRELLANNPSTGNYHKLRVIINSHWKAGYPIQSEGLSDINFLLSEYINCHSRYKILNCGTIKRTFKVILKISARYQSIAIFNWALTATSRTNTRKISCTSVFPVFTGDDYGNLVVCPFSILSLTLNR